MSSQRLNVCYRDRERERTNNGRKMEFLSMIYLIKIHILNIYSMSLFSRIQKKGIKSTDIESTFEFRVSMLTVQRFFNQSLKLLTLHS